jgi:hypothetical protein
LVIVVGSVIIADTNVKPDVGYLNVLTVLGVLNVLNVLNVLDVLNVMTC